MMEGKFLNSGVSVLGSGKFLNHAVPGVTPKTQLGFRV